MSLPAAVLPDDPDALVSLLLDTPYVRDPYPVASRLREIAPVHRTNRGFWLVSDAASVEQVSRGPTLRIGFDTVRRGAEPPLSGSPAQCGGESMQPSLPTPHH